MLTVEEVTCPESVISDNGGEDVCEFLPLCCLNQSLPTLHIPSEEGKGTFPSHTDFVGGGF